ncbi:hypothetical protein TWF225_009267 [Orbilia oligospora]|nr:hypothetical protein TWF225_009267 [Orbilia oligospora]KAF3269902.1 hypothetical protein TWF217_008251 [Orbilia oligospora]KAF3270360.1 hypothetical protein TWF128_004142 [Orbilia oligospora]KAF3298150.1 hypothetical protein TWF132_004285 [Orbilia oligospora]
MVRVKQRYLLFTILYPSGPQSTSNNTTSSKPTQSMIFHSPSPQNLTRTTLASIIRSSISTNFGDWGIGQCGSFAVKYFSSATSTGILRITRDNYRTLWAALTYIRELCGQPAVIKVVRISGTIRKAELEAVKLAEDAIRRVKKEAKGAKTGASAGGTNAGDKKGVAGLFGGGKPGQPATAVDEEQDQMLVDIVVSDDDDDD